MTSTVIRDNQGCRVRVLSRTPGQVTVHRGSAVRIHSGVTPIKRTLR